METTSSELFTVLIVMAPCFRLTDKQVKQCIAVLDTDGDGEVSLSEFMVLVNEPMKSAVKKIKAVNAIKSFSKE